MSSIFTLSDIHRIYYQPNYFHKKDNQPVMLQLNVHLKVVELSQERSEIKALVEMLLTQTLMPLFGFGHFRVHIAWCHFKQRISY